MTVPAWHQIHQHTVHSDADLVRFVNVVGCCTINALERFPEFPSAAVAMGQAEALWTSWFWKDDLHIEKQVYYTRLFAGRPGFIALEWLPAFIAANGAAADELFFTGTMPAKVETLYRVIEEHGPIAIRDLKKRLTPDLRKAATGHLWELERRFLVTKTGLTGRERGTYGYIWDLADRWLPDAFTAADRLKPKPAIEKITTHLAALGVPVEARLTKRVLRWGER